jgi:hypothetical protein
MNERDLLVRVDNAMIVLLTPQELEEFAEVERIEKESKATISGLLEKVKGRRISGWRDKEPVEALAILDKLTPEDREFFRCCYPEELEQYSMALRALAEAQLAKADFYRIAERRAAQSGFHQESPKPNLRDSERLLDYPGTCSCRFEVLQTNAG